MSPMSIGIEQRKGGWVGVIDDRPLGTGAFYILSTLFDQSVLKISI